VLSPLPTRYTLGLDLGKLTDYTALAVVEEQAVERGPEWWSPKIPEPLYAEDPAHTCTWLQRWPLRTEYHTIARDVAAMVERLAGRPRATVRLFFDHTGVGTAVAEQLRAQSAIARIGAIAVTITGGHQVTREDDGYHVPKRELIFATHVAMQRGTLKVVPALPEAATVRKELETFEVKITAAANQVFQHREGAHDDVLLALSIAHWGAGQRAPVASVYNYRHARWE
jgi:hypothetical protein